MTKRLSATASIAFASARLAFATDIKTDTWGAYWERPASMSAVVNEEHTPGSDSFKYHRLKKPALYAFFEGFDARAHATMLTNIVYVRFGQGRYDLRIEYTTNGIVRATNTTHRLSLFDEYARRSALLRKLEVWERDDSGVMSSRNGLLGSSAQDETSLTSPQQSSFDWTEDGVSMIYETGERKTTSGWFQSFVGLKPSDAFTPYNVDEGTKGSAYFMLEDVTFHDPAFYALEKADIDATPYTFEQLADEVYGHSVVSNMLNDSLRLNSSNLGARNQTLALFDKTVRRDTFGWSSVTNEVESHYRASIRGDVAGPSISLRRTASGGYEIEPKRFSLSVSSMQDEITTAVTNNLISNVNFPEIDVSVPVTYAGIAARAVGASASVSLDSSGFPMNAELDDYFDARGGDGEYEFEASATPDPFDNRVDVTFTDIHGYSIYGSVPLPDVSGSSIPVQGNASISTSYSSRTRLERKPSDPWNFVQRWPSVYLYPDPNKKIRLTFLGSYAATTRSSGSICFTDGAGRETDDWKNRAGYGYRAQSYTVATGAKQVFEGYFDSEWGSAVGKLTGVCGPYYDPLSYTGISRGVLSSICGEEREWTVNVVYGGLATSKNVCISRSGGSYSYEVVGDGVGPKGTLGVFGIEVTLTPNGGVSLSPYNLKSRPFTGRSKIASIREVYWKFPQLYRE